MKIDLTEEGLSHVDDVIEVFFQYIKMIKEKDGIQEWLFDEMKTIQSTEFRCTNIRAVNKKPTFYSYYSTFKKWTNSYKSFTLPYL